MISENPGPSGPQRKLSPIVRQLGYSGSPLSLDEWSKLRRTIVSTLGEAGENAARLPPVMLSCEMCGKTFMRGAAEVKKHQRRGLTEFYCSEPCACRGHNFKRFGERLCMRCGSPAMRSGSSGTPRLGRLFCSQECMKAVQAEESEIRARSRMKPCEQCQVMFAPWNTGTRFCSMLCKNAAHSEAMRKRDNPNWHGGVDQRRYSGTNQKSLREARILVLQRDDHQCLLCKAESRLQVHHLNEVNIDNRIENLATVCKSCHSSLHFSESKKMLSSQLKILVERKMFLTSR
jgi:5-methylcytosine-specific restriction endonuclease McrA